MDDTARIVWTQIGESIYEARAYENGLFVATIELNDRNIYTLRSPVLSFGFEILAADDLDSAKSESIDILEDGYLCHIEDCQDIVACLKGGDKP